LKGKNKECSKASKAKKIREIKEIKDSRPCPRRRRQSKGFFENNQKDQVKEAENDGNCKERGEKTGSTSCFHIISTTMTSCLDKSFHFPSKVMLEMQLKFQNTHRKGKNLFFTYGSGRNGNSFALPSSSEFGSYSFSICFIQNVGQIMDL